MSTERLYRRERLKSKKAVERLFAGAGATAAMAYPWRAVAMPSADEGVGFARFVVMVPKRRLRHAVDRVTMRRRLREAYRLTRPFAALTSPDSRGVDIAFIYVANELTSYRQTCVSLQRLSASISRAIASQHQASDSE